MGVAWHAALPSSDHTPVPWSGLVSERGGRASAAGSVAWRQRERASVYRVNRTATAEVDPRERHGGPRRERACRVGRCAYVAGGRDARVGLGAAASGRVHRRFGRTNDAADLAKSKIIPRRIVLRATPMDTKRPANKYGYTSITHALANRHQLAHLSRAHGTGADGKTHQHGGSAHSPPQTSRHATCSLAIPSMKQSSMNYTTGRRLTHGTL